MSEEQVPELKPGDVKVGTVNEAYWTSVKNQIQEQNLNFRRQIEINNHILALAMVKIKEEERKH